MNASVTESFSSKYLLRFIRKSIKFCFHSFPNKVQVPFYQELKGFLLSWKWKSLLVLQNQKPNLGIWGYKTQKKDTISCTLSNLTNLYILFPHVTIYVLREQTATLLHRLYYKFLDKNYKRSFPLVNRTFLHMLMIFQSP